MTAPRFGSSWRSDLPASIVVALVALPLCLGVALASGAPLFAGLISGIVGGLVIGLVSRSSLSVSGPAAGLTAIVLTAIEAMPTYQTFLLAVMLAGMIQIGFSLTRGGVLAEFVPTSVITGMLAAIGIILILKQFPHAIGYDGDYEGSFRFFQEDGRNTLSTILYTVREEVLVGPAWIALISLIFLFWWEKAKPKQGPLKLLPGPLVVVAFGILANLLLQRIAPQYAVQQTHLVNVPVVGSAREFVGLFQTPDFTAIGSGLVWTTALTVAIVASLESLLSVKAVDEIDPKRRVTDKNRELLAQGTGNIVAGLLGGIPVTSVIVRSSANVDSGADSKLSTMLHGFWLLLSVVAIPFVLNMIPLAALAAILIQTGYKLTKPALYIQRFRQGYRQFVPFFVTVAAILFTDLLEGIAIGMVVGFVFVIARNFRQVISYVETPEGCMVRARRDLYFIHKPQLQAALEKVPDGYDVLIDLSSTSYVDDDNIDIINAFIKGAPFRDISILVKGDLSGRSARQIMAPVKEVRFA